jgi:hypothetical protein
VAAYLVKTSQRAPVKRPGSEFDGWLSAGVLTGSSALLAEAAHSAADTMNQAFLLASIRRGRRPADRRHPFGYGQERYFWSLLAAFGIFVAGAGFSVFEGVLAITHPGHGHDVLVGYDEGGAVRGQHGHGQAGNVEDLSDRIDQRLKPARKRAVRGPGAGA